MLRAEFAALTKQLYVYTGDLGLAQDLVQEAFARALPRWSRVCACDDPVAWIRRVAFNLANSRWQRAKVATRYLRGQREQHIAGPGPDRVAAVRALSVLPAAQRRAVVLHYLADRPVADNLNGWQAGSSGACVFTEGAKPAMCMLPSLAAGADRVVTFPVTAAAGPLPAQCTVSVLSVDKDGGTYPASGSSASETAVPAVEG